MPRLLSLVFRGSLYLASLFSPSSAYRLAGVFAWAMARSESARHTAVNLATCYPELDVEARAERQHESLRHMALLFFELAALRYHPQARLLSDITLRDEAVLQAAIAEKKGVILLVPHLGNWELMCVFLGHHYTVSALYDPPKVQGLEAEIKTARERFNGKMFAIGVGGIRSVLRELKSGGLVAILPDQVPDQDGGVYAPFFNRPALTMTLPFQLHKKTQAAVVMGSVIRTPTRGYQLSFSRLATAPTPEAFCAQMNQAIEQEISQAPEQYQWEYKRFRKPPEGGRNNIYRRQ